MEPVFSLAPGHGTSCAFDVNCRVIHHGSREKGDSRQPQVKPFPFNKFLPCRSGGEPSLAVPPSCTCAAEGGKEAAPHPVHQQDSAPKAPSVLAWHSSLCLRWLSHYTATFQNLHRKTRSLREHPGHPPGRRWSRKGLGGRGTWHPHGLAGSLLFHILPTFHPSLCSLHIPMCRLGVRPQGRHEPGVSRQG